VSKVAQPRGISNLKADLAYSQFNNALRRIPGSSLRRQVRWTVLDLDRQITAFDVRWVASFGPTMVPQIITSLPDIQNVGKIAW